MRVLTVTAMALAIFVVLGATQKGEAKANFSFYLGVPAPRSYYVAPTYVQPPYYVAPPVYVAPTPRYYVVPQQPCYRVYEYTPYGAVYY